MKYGIFGGAFDPPHVEHIEIANRAVEELGLDLLYVVVTYIPPHKKGATASFLDRVEMAKIAFSDNPKIVVTDIESTLKDSYSITVVSTLKALHPEDQWYFIMGGDSVEQLLTWYRPDKLASMVTLALVKRQGYITFKDSLIRLQSTLNIDYVIMDYEGANASSSVVQGELELYRDSRYLTPQIVSYIRARGLYNDYAELVAKVNKAMSAKTFAHCCRTVLTALAYRSALKLSFQEVFVSALLHDIAKDQPQLNLDSPVKHQFEGARIAREDYNITNPSIISAIETHTTGAPNMTPLQKLIYLADMLEPNRDFPTVDELRQAVQEDFDRGFLLAVERTMDYLLSTNRPIHPLTEACLAFYKNK